MKWLNNNLLFILSLFLLIFIPLYPKLPLWDVLPGYIVKIRIEDFLVLFTGLIWLRDVRAKRIIWNTNYFWLVCLYGLAGLASILTGVVLLKTIPFEMLHIGKSALILARYLEYFTLFFFFFSSLKTKKQLYAVITAMIVTLFAVVAYGMGQQYLHFPLFSTMNREYSKGEMLYLEQGARPQSTFAGHYDLAAYLVVLLPLIFSLLLGSIEPSLKPKKLLISLVYVVALISGLIMLMMTDSKTSIAACFAGLGLVSILYWLKLPSVALKRYVAMGVMVVLIFFGVSFWKFGPTSLKTKLTNQIAKLMPSKTDQPSDLIGDGYQDKTIRTALPDGTTKIQVVREKSTWSQNAIKYGLSMGIRLDTLWPQALLGFARSPLTGSGYGTLAMLDTSAFQEADSTDNNYLRVIGETGVIGFVAFYGFIFFLLVQTLKFSRVGNLIQNQLAAGLVGSIVGLLMSAVYLDVFAASKVAFIFWALCAVVIKINSKSEASTKILQNLLEHFKKFWPLYIGVLFFFLMLQQNPFLEHTPLKDIDTFVGGLEQITAARCFVSQHFLGLCRNSGIHGDRIFSLYAVLLIPFLTLFHNITVFAYLNLILLGSSLLITYFYLRNKLKTGQLFVGLLSAIALMSVIKITAVPLGFWSFVLLMTLPPVIIFLIGKFNQKYLPLFGLLVLVIFTRSVITGDLSLRFRNLAPNEAFKTLQLADGVIAPVPNSKAYLGTIINPYYADAYVSGLYWTIPLSESQPYGKQTDVTSLYAKLLSQGNSVYLSDFGIDREKSYAQSFKSIKNNFDLSYVNLGCDERCNLYTVKLATSSASPKIISNINGHSIDPVALGDTYKFAVVSNRFDARFASYPVARDTYHFQKQLTALKTSYDFMVVTGQVAPDDNEGYTQGFVDQFVSKVNYPVLQERNRYQEFHTKSEYFVLLPVDAKSQLSMETQLSLYTSLLKVEKLTTLKSLFIISDNLNWQTNSDSKNALSILLAKLKTFPQLHTYILTSNHDDILNQASWYESKSSSDGMVTYYASLNTGSDRNRYIEVEITDQGKVLVQDKRL